MVMNWFQRVRYGTPDLVFIKQGQTVNKIPREDLDRLQKNPGIFSLGPAAQVSCAVLL